MAVARQQTTGGIVAFDLAIPHVNDALGVGRHVAVVRDDDDREPRRVQLLEHPQDFFARPRVEVSGWLVGQQKLRPVHERACNGDALLLTAGHLARLVMHPLRQPHAFQEGRAAVELLAVVDAGRRISQRHGHLVERGGPREQVEALKDEADLTIAQMGPLVGVVLRNLLVLEPIPAGRGMIEAAQQVHQRGLARAGGPHQGHHFPFPDFERHAPQDGHVDLTQMVGLGDVFETDQGHGQSPDSLTDRKSAEVNRADWPATLEAGREGNRPCCVN